MSPGFDPEEAATELFFHGRHTQQVVLETDGAGAVATRYVLDSSGVPVGQQKGSVFGWYVTDILRHHVRTRVRYRSALGVSKSV